jgi:signal transduction histidine kinase
VDSTDRERVAASEIEIRHAFLLSLNERLRPLRDPAEIQCEVTRALGAHLGANRVAYAESTGEDEIVVVAPHYTNGVVSIAGTYRFTDFGETLYADLSTGRTFVATDIAGSQTLSAQEKAAHAAIETGAIAGVPLVKGGRLVGVLSVHYREAHAFSPGEIALIEAVAERTWAAVERQRAEQALRLSEEKYRTLFNEMDQGFCILQMMFDEQARPIDYRYIETNPVFERRSGMSNAFGKTVRELVPDVEPFWFDIYGNVAVTGTPTHFESYARPVGRWFEVSAFRIGEPDKHQVAVLFNDITERKRRETNLAFLAEISQDLTRLTGEREIMETIGGKIARHLQVKACNFCELDESQGEITINYNWNEAGTPDLRRTYRAGEYLTREFARANRAGEEFVVRDTATDLRTDREQCAALQIGSFVMVPFHHRGAWKYFLGVTDSRAREWRTDEIELLREVSTRLFPRLERARTEEALRVSEEKYRTLFNSIDEGFYLAEAIFDSEGQCVDVLYLEENPASIRMIGKSAKGLLLSQLDPHYEDFWREIFGHTAKTGEPQRLERYTAPIDRWLDFYVFKPEGVKDDRRFAIVYHDISKRKRAEEALRQAHTELETRVQDRTQELAAVMKRLVNVEEEERRRIARDLHDDIGQKMTALHLKLAALQQQLHDAPAQQQLADTQAFALQIDRDLRLFAGDLRSASLYTLGLSPALEDLAEAFTATHGTVVHYAGIDAGRERLTSELEVNLYRIAQEALHNIHKHARAQHVDIFLQHTDGRMVLTVADDGCGFDLEAARQARSERMGLVGMRERAALIGGRLEIETAPGDGTSVIVTAPAVFRESPAAPPG